MTTDTVTVSRTLQVLAAMESTQESAVSVENLVRRIISSMPMAETNTCTSRDEQRSHTQQQEQQELNRAFNLPRGSVVGQSQSSASPTPLNTQVQTETNRNPPQGEVLRYQYNPRVNYGYTHYNRNVRRASRSRGLTPYATARNSSSSSSGKSSSKRVEPPSFKEVILLPNPGYTDVPKYKKKSDLHKQGLIIDSVPIEKSWTEKELKEKIQSIFEKKLKCGNTCIGFDFVKGIGGTLNEINLPKGTELSGKVLLGIVKQGPIYIMPNSSVIDDQEEYEMIKLDGDGSGYGDDDDDDAVILKEFPAVLTSPDNVAVNDRSAGRNTILPYVFRKNMPESSASTVVGIIDPKPNIGMLNEIPATEHNSSCINELVVIFPNKPKAYLERKLEQFQYDINETIGEILNDADSQQDQQEPVFDLPLTISQKSPLEALSLFRERSVDSTVMDQTIRASHDSSSILWTMFRQLKSGNFNLKAKPNVIFSNELGIDADGLTRELCHMVMTTLTNGKGGIQLFEGMIDHLIPIHSEEYIASKYFEYAGKLIAHSVIHAGFGMVGLSRAIVEYLLTGDIDSCVPYVSVEDIPDLDIQEHIKQIQDAESIEQVNALLEKDDISLLLSQAGFVNEFVNLSNKHRACQCIIIHVVFRTRREELQQLMDGMENASLLQFLQLCKSCVSCVFPLQKEVTFTSTDFLNTIRKSWLQSLHGNEKIVMNWFMQYVEDIEKGNSEMSSDEQASTSILSCLPTLGQLTQFMAGHPYLPSTKPVISFHSNFFPDADSCFFSIVLPTSHSTYQQFKRAMNTAISSQHLGYGRG